MKIPYTITQLHFIEYMKVTFPAKVMPSWYSWTGEKKEVSEWPEGTQACLQADCRSAPRSVARQAELKDKYDVDFSVSVSLGSSESEHSFSTFKVFDDRNAMLKWAHERGETVPTECNKHAMLVDGVIKTQVTHRIEIEDYTIHLQYTRDGAPTARCRIVTTTEQTIVCDLEEVI